MNIKTMSLAVAVFAICLSCKAKKENSSIDTMAPETETAPLTDEEFYSLNIGEMLKLWNGEEAFRDIDPQRYAMTDIDGDGKCEFYLYNGNSGYGMLFARGNDSLHAVLAENEKATIMVCGNCLKMGQPSGGPTYYTQGVVLKGSTVVESYGEQQIYDDQEYECYTKNLPDGTAKAKAFFTTKGKYGNFRESLKFNDYRPFASKAGFGFSDFAISNENGSKVILKGDKDPYAPDFVYAILDSKVFPIRYEKYQNATEEDNSRDAYYNFDNMAGNVFRVTEGKLGKELWTTIVLADSNFMAQYEVVKYKTMGSFNKMPQKLVSKFENRYGRKVTTSFMDVGFDGRKFVGVQFENRETDALAVMAIVSDDNEILATIDFPAKYDEMSTWRVDDGGEFGFYGITSILKDRNDGSYICVVESSAPESILTCLMRQKGGILYFDKRMYRYTMPL